jgi:hypothetical protein
LNVVRIDCPRSNRAGSYRRDGLMARFGADAALPDVLMALAACERRKDFSRPCGAKRLFRPGGHRAADRGSAGEGAG